MADYYELLGVPRTRQRRRAEEGVPASAPASCTPTPTRATPLPRSSSSRWPGPTRCSATPSSGRATTASASRASAAPAAEHGRHLRRWRGLGDLFDAFFGGGGSPFGGGRVAGRARLAGRTSRSWPTSPSSRRCSVPPCRSRVRTALRCDDCEGTRRRRGHQAGHLQRVQRPRPGAAGAPEHARPDGHLHGLPEVRRPRPGHRHPVPVRATARAG